MYVQIAASNALQHFRGISRLATELPQDAAGHEESGSDGQHYGDRTDDEQQHSCSGVAAFRLRGRLLIQLVFVFREVLYHGQQCFAARIELLPQHVGGVGILVLDSKLCHFLG
ncbi:MAG: hypothetical protein KGJ72_07520, partial [Gammaproteobacteria bacterium]|nr:hypothetical protein [Gammaproteobacteria bacterium]